MPVGADFPWNGSRTSTLPLRRDRSKRKGSVEEGCVVGLCPSSIVFGNLFIYTPIYLYFIF